MREKFSVDIHAIIRSEDGKILLGLRKNTNYCDGFYHLPSGHLEEGETILDALVRESREELGIIISPENATLVYTLHQKSNGEGRIGFFFEVKSSSWGGKIENQEPDKCVHLRWFDKDDLPLKIVPYAEYVLKNYQSNKHHLGFYNW